jgi:hypothetical protein
MGYERRNLLLRNARNVQRKVGSNLKMSAKTNEEPGAVATALNEIAVRISEGVFKSRAVATAPGSVFVDPLHIGFLDIRNLHPSLTRT